MPIVLRIIVILVFINKLNCKYFNDNIYLVHDVFHFRVLNVHSWRNSCVI